jgi:hypothetical protein
VQHIPEWAQLFGLSAVPAGIFYLNMREGRGHIQWSLPAPDRKKQPRWFWTVQSFWGSLVLLCMAMGFGELFGIFPL